MIVVKVMTSDDYSDNACGDGCDEDENDFDGICGYDNDNNNYNGYDFDDDGDDDDNENDDDQ